MIVILEEQWQFSYWYCVFIHQCKLSNSQMMPERVGQFCRRLFSRQLECFSYLLTIWLFITGKCVTWQIFLAFSVAQHYHLNQTEQTQIWNHTQVKAFWFFSHQKASWVYSAVFYLDSGIFHLSFIIQICPLAWRISG